jgi:MFS family permease
MPIAIGVGRRIVLLGSTLILVAGALLCAFASNYSWHLGARCLVGLAAGQPMITSELFFLHERSRYLMTQQAIQVILTTVYVVFASPIAGAITPTGWYCLGAGLSAICLILTAVALPETKYARPLSSFQEGTDSSSDLEQTIAKGAPEAVLCTTKPELDFINFERRTFRTDLRLWTGKPSMALVLSVYKVDSSRPPISLSY